MCKKSPGDIKNNTQWFFGDRQLACMKAFIEAMYYSPILITCSYSICVCSSKNYLVCSWSGIKETHGKLNGLGRLHDNRLSNMLRTIALDRI